MYLGPKPIQSAYSNNRCCCKRLGVVYAQVLEGRQGAYRRRNNIVSDQEEGADDGKDLRTMPNAGVNSASVWIVATDGYVVHSDQRGWSKHIAAISQKELYPATAKANLLT